MENLLNENYFMKEAVKEAKKAYNKGEVPIGAVITINNKIIARAHNLSQTLKDATAHAEMLAITSASNYLNGKYLKNCTLYVSLEPCVMCAGAIFWCQLGRLVYSASDPKRGYSNHKELLHPKTIVERGAFEMESKALIQDFFSKKRK
tara:strand:- start:12 stop:455 length:444 start_codon:yes stop_codon:yes gene_type:complete